MFIAKIEMTLMDGLKDWFYITAQEEKIVSGDPGNACKFVNFTEALNEMVRATNYLREMYKITGWVIEEC